MVSLETPVCEFGQPASDFSLLGTDNKKWTLEQCRGKNGLLIMFICNHCPYVQAIMDRLIRDTKALKKLGVNTVAIMSNDPADYPEDDLESMQKIAQQYQFSFPYLFDETQQIAKNFGAVCTPDFFGYNKDLQLQYRGRFDESKKQAAATDARPELFEAMKLIAETGQGPQQQIPSMGCSIKWRTD